MLHDFLLKERKNILALCAKKLTQVKEAKSSSNEMEVGLPIFYDELIEVLLLDVEDEAVETVNKATEDIHRASATRRGIESLRLGYTISQVVHGYGALCQSITEYATTHRDEPIQPREFNRLNYCLDVAIAEAVTGFSGGQNDATAREEVQRLGFLAHEMRNALNNAATAHQMIKRGLAGFGGSTSHVLEEALTRMKDIIDRSLSEVRLRGESTVDLRRCRVIDLVGEVEVIAAFEANARSVQLHIDVAPELVVEADRHLVVSAISNLVQNAIKFTTKETNVWIRGRSVENRILIEIEDECGGLPSGKIEELFQLFTQKGDDKSGVGLGLSISRRAISLNEGGISARDIPGKGCIFTINLPQVGSIPGEEVSVPIH